MVKHIALPHNGFQFRYYQAQLQEYLLENNNDNSKFAYCKWHRKSGKDEAMLHIELQKMLMRRGNYVHLFEYASDARIAIWDGINPHTGNNRIRDVFPDELIENINNTKMLITLKNGSTLRFGGYDNFDNLVGSLPVGIVLSEYAVSNRSHLAFDAFYPQIVKSKGYIALITTPRGKNHAYELWQNIQDSDDWFKSSIRADESGVYNEEELVKAKKALVESKGEKHGTAVFNQEFMVDFMQAVSGSFYAEFFEQARDDGRLVDNMMSIPMYRDIIEDENIESYASFDIGVADNTSIWIGKKYKNQFIVYDFFENRGKLVEYYLDWMKENHPLVEKLVLPHDVRVREWISGSRAERIKNSGFEPIVSPEVSRYEGIHVVKETLPYVHFDMKKCYKGVNALINYHQNYNDALDVYSVNPIHDKHSDAADSFRYFCLFVQKRLGIIKN